ncbi:NAD(P)H-dependent glycerol-3-phosphate dehydrogenase [Heliobacterium gestii]|uniref:Glycerol-3-phosphate dehydrogenase [NAD(P)+] n=1 Tax=Heliomicrobium gestii TaxID=2699 RepID=A0A845LDZ9_HELGE|nr:NAD(P)H-dependent glycerol-3-phosphate dehydrogenase [Heliomicrobium gestii]MBM7865521.1 glycerol-3-phosphate dehydrogenase (NAD(P)+) [Heliomicrobium gestii]MZP41773.1 NAD(P)H-dependent glycerol-3-phosphate dehydrogenase [Heliomicrobium gestii]
MQSEKVAVLGAGSWGTALGRLLVQQGKQVYLWSRRNDLAKDINSYRENRRYLPGVLLPAKVRAYSDVDEVLKEAATIVLALPSSALRETAALIRDKVEGEALIISTSKGIDPETLKRPSQILREELPKNLADRVVVLSGPSHAEEVARDIPTTVVVSAEQRAVAEQAQDLLMRSHFRVYTNPDLLGLELGGSLKNIIALACGVAEGLGFGDNTKAALVTRGLAEIIRLGTALGARETTFAGLAGLGDLVVTCTSKHSRNMRFGSFLGKGKPVEESLALVGQTVESIRTTRAAYQLAKAKGIEMPITEECYRVLFEDAAPADAVGSLMTRLKTHEVEEGVEGWN